MATATTGTSCADLSAFQRDILAVLARDGTEYGLGIKEAVEDARGENIHHGRLYPNLNTLIEMGYIEMSELDGRTNEYSLTGSGRGELLVYQQWLADCLEDSDVE